MKNCKSDSPTALSSSCGSTPAMPSAQLVYPFRLVIPGRLPSWNVVLGMGHWQRAKLKKQIQDAFLCALRATADDCSMKTTSARNMLLIAAATLESYQETTRLKRESLRLKKRQEKQRKKERRSS